MRRWDELSGEAPKRTSVSSSWGLCRGAFLERPFPFQVLLPARNPGQGGRPAAGLPVQRDAQEHRDYRGRKGRLAGLGRAEAPSDGGVLRARAALPGHAAADPGPACCQEAQHPAGREQGQHRPRSRRQLGGDGRRSEDSDRVGHAGRESEPALSGRCHLQPFSPQVRVQPIGAARSDRGRLSHRRFVPSDPPPPL